MVVRLILLAFFILIFTGCASQEYKQTGEGSFSGALDVRWVKNDYFVFIPNKDNPLTFTRPNGQIIRPGTMYTDGGSIPRLLWGVKGYSPWGYAPAYIMHDWLFQAKHCGYKPYNQYKFEDSVDVMAETLKAVMENDTEVRNYFVFDSIVASIASPIAKQLWDKGTCNAPKYPISKKISPDELPGELIMTIKY